MMIFLDMFLLPLVVAIFAGIFNITSKEDQERELLAKKIAEELHKRK